MGSYYDIPTREPSQMFMVGVLNYPPGSTTYEPCTVGTIRTSRNALGMYLRYDDSTHNGLRRCVFTSLLHAAFSITTYSDHTSGSESTTSLRRIHHSFLVH